MKPASAPSHPLVVVGASFGGVEALLALVAGLPKDFAAFVAVVQHIGSQPSVLPELLARAGPLPASHPRHGEPLRPNFEGVEPMENLQAIGTQTQLTCPDCGGTLSEVQSGRPLRYRCHIGHAYTAMSLESAQAEHTDHALMASLRALKEREQLLRRLAVVSRGIGDAAQAELGLRQAARVQAQAARLAELIAEGTGGA